MTETLTAEELQQNGLIAIVRADAEADWVAVAQALADGGIRAMEVTLNTPGALAAIRVLRERLLSTMRVGAGTILCPEDAWAAFEAGAEFIVTPTLQPETIALCRRRNAPVLCGCMTPTEALAAHQAGADFIKLFPADTLGPAHVRAFLAPLPFLKIMPVGGVSLDTLPEFIRAGCVGAGLGGNLVSKAVLREHNWARLTETARDYVRVLAEARDGTVRMI